MKRRSYSRVGQLRPRARYASSSGTGAHRADGRAVQRRPRLYQGIGQVRRAGPEVLRQTCPFTLHKNSSLASRSSIRIHVQGRRSLWHRLASSHVDIRKAAPLSCPVCVQGHRTHEQVVEATSCADRRRSRTKAEVVLIGYAAADPHIFANKPLRLRSKASRCACRARRSGRKRLRRRHVSDGHCLYRSTTPSRRRNPAGENEAPASRR